MAFQIERVRSGNWIQMTLRFFRSERKWEDDLFVFLPPFSTNCFARLHPWLFSSTWVRLKLPNVKKRCPSSIRLHPSSDFFPHRIKKKRNSHEIPVNKSQESKGENWDAERGSCCNVPFSLYVCATKEKNPTLKSNAQKTCKKDVHFPPTDLRHDLNVAPASVRRGGGDDGVGTSAELRWLLLLLELRPVKRVQREAGQVASAVDVLLVLLSRRSVDSVGGASVQMGVMVVARGVGHHAGNMHFNV